MTGAGKSHPGLMLEKSALLFPLGSDGCKNKPVGEDDSVGGINLLERLLCGEKIILAILLGNNTLWEERRFAEMLMITPLGMKISPRTIFPWLLAEDNPVISW